MDLHSLETRGSPWTFGYEEGRTTVRENYTPHLDHPDDLRPVQTSDRPAFPFLLRFPVVKGTLLPPLGRVYGRGVQGGRCWVDGRRHLLRP